MGPTHWFPVAQARFASIFGTYKSSQGHSNTKFVLELHVFGLCTPPQCLDIYKQKICFQRRKSIKRSMFTLSMPFPFPALAGPSLGSYQSIYLTSLSCAFIKGRKKSPPSILPLLCLPGQPSVWLTNWTSSCSEQKKKKNTILSL